MKNLFTALAVLLFGFNILLAGNMIHDPELKSGTVTEEKDTLTAAADFLNSKEILSVYPNPASKILYIKTGTLKGERLEIFNVLGAKQISINIQTESSVLTISLDKLPEGMYFARLIGDNNQIIQTKTFSKVK